MTALLSARDISVSRGGKFILRNVDLELRSADFIVIAGPNGSGKSSLLRALAGLWPVTTGEVLLNGEALRDKGRREIARTISYVPQDTRIDFGFTVQEIVAMGRHPHVGRFSAESAQDREAVNEAVALCDIGHLRGRAVNTLSGGERQRVLIARCLAAKPQCILLDEPTASLDLEHSLEIFALAQRLAGTGRSIALSTHDLNNGLRFARSALILSEGAVAHNGPAGERLERSTIEAVFRIRVELLSTADGAAHYVFHPKESTT